MEDASEKNSEKIVDTHSPGCYYPKRKSNVKEIKTTVMNTSGFLGIQMALKLHHCEVKDGSGLFLKKLLRFL